MLAKGEDIALAIRMVTAFDEVWLFESLLAGSSIDKKGYLVPGIVLKNAGDKAEILGLVALSNAPKSAQLPEYLDKSKVKYWKSQSDLLDLFGTYVCPKASNIKSEGDLYLYDLDELSDGAAEALSRHEGKLHLRNLASLTYSTGYMALAEALSRHKGELDLYGLTSLSDYIAEALSRYKGELGLGNLKSLSDAAAESLSRHKGLLGLRGLTSLSDAAAEVLSKHEGDLDLNGLKSLWVNDSLGHIALAKKVVSQKGDVNLSYLTSLSDGAAEVLSRYKGELNLWNLKSLSDAAAEALSRHNGSLYLRGLTSLSDAAAEALSKHEEDLDLGGLSSFWANDSSGHIALAKKVASQKGYLNLSGLTSLSDAAAEALSKRKGDLNLSNLKKLGDAAAKSLSRYKGDLRLNGLTSLSDAAAESLSKHEGKLDLEGLKSLSDAAAKSLAKKFGGMRNLSVPYEIKKQIQKHRK